MEGDGKRFAGPMSNCFLRPCSLCHYAPLIRSRHTALYKCVLIDWLNIVSNCTVEQNISASDLWHNLTQKCHDDDKSKPLSSWSSALLPLTIASVDSSVMSPCLTDRVTVPNLIVHWPPATRCKAVHGLTACKQDLFFCPRGALRRRPWSRRLHHCLHLPN